MVKVRMGKIRQALLFGFGLLLLAGPAGADEAWNPDQFQVTDMPWVDNRQLALYLDGSGNIHQSAIANGTLNFTNAAASQETAAALGQANLAPEIQYFFQTRAQELALDLPLSLGFSAEQNTEKTVSYSMATASWRENNSTTQTTSLETRPVLAVTYFFEPFFFNAETTTWGREVFIHQQNRTRDYQAGQWSPESSVSQNNEAYSFAATQVFRFGWGRIFEGKYAYQALQLADELAEGGLLQHPVSTAGFSKLSEAMAYARQSFVLDPRLKTILALRAIMRELQAQGDIRSGDTEALLTVSDIYQNVSDHSRAFGWTANARLGGRINLDNQETTRFDAAGSLLSYSKNEIVPYQAFAGAEARYEAPLTRQWQFGAQVVADTIFFWTDSSERDNSPPQLTASAHACLDYYLDTRWQIGLSADLDLGYDLIAHHDLLLVNNQYLDAAYQRKQEKYTLALTAQRQLGPDVFLNGTLGTQLENKQYQQFMLSGEYTPGAGQYTVDRMNELEPDVLQNNNWSWYFRLGLKCRLL